MIPSLANLVSFSWETIYEQGEGHFPGKPTRNTNFGALQDLDQTMHVWTVHVYAHEFLSRAQQCLVSRLRRMRHNIIEHGIAYPPRARNNDRTKGGISIWDVPKEGLVQRVIEPRETLFVSGRRAGTLAWDRNVDTLQHDGHVL